MAETENKAVEKTLPYNEEAYKALALRYTMEKSQLLFDVRDGKKKKEDLLEDATDFLEEYGAGFTGFDSRDKKAVEKLITHLCDNLLGYGILTELIADDTISDINILRWDTIIIKRKGKRYLADIKFDSPEAYQRFVDGICTRNHVNTSTRHATSRFTDNKTSDRAILRFSLVTPFLTSDGVYKVFIRKTLKDFPELKDLMAEDMLDQRIADRLLSNFRTSSMLICGGVSSGKTTLLNALKEEIDSDKMVLVIQQAEELTSKKRKMISFLHSVEGSMESDVRYGLEELSNLGLTLDTDVFIIGEIKGAETTDLLKCSNTGGICAGTIHSNSPEEALDRVIDYSLHAANNAYTKSELVDMLKSFKTMVFMKNYKVARISELKGVENGKPEYRCIYDREKGIDYLDRLDTENILDRIENFK